jgi:hypothetical protein
VYPVVRATRGGDAVAEARITEESDTKQLLAGVEHAGVDSTEFAPASPCCAKPCSSTPSWRRPRSSRCSSSSTTPTGRPGSGRWPRSPNRWRPPTPNLHGPRSPLGNMVAGPLASVVDRTRDGLRSLAR